jgi:hypothetical protein
VDDGLIKDQQLQETTTTARAWRGEKDDGVKQNREHYGAEVVGVPLLLWSYASTDLESL